MGQLVGLLPLGCNGAWSSLDRPRKIVEIFRRCIVRMAVPKDKFSNRY